MKTLSRQRDFDRVFRKGKTVRGGLFTLHYVKNRCLSTQWGFVVTKKVGKAVVRNKIRRRFKALALELEPRLNSSCKIIVRAQNAVLQASYSQMRAQMIKSLERARLIQLPN